jgi:purine-binding chemotaxis protein CheW
MSLNADVLTDTDWEGIRRRVSEVGVAIATGFRPSPEEEQRILRARAQALAEELAAEDEADTVLEAVEFELANEHYALPIAQVKEVSLLKELIPVPCTPPFVRGLINLRGELCTVIDLKRFFDLPDTGITELNKIIIAQHGDMRLGILADAIIGVRRIRLQELQSGLPTLTGLRADYLRGVTSGRLAVLDAASILSDERLFVEEEVAT